MNDDKKNFRRIIPVIHRVQTDFGASDTLSIFDVPKGAEWVGFGTKVHGKPHFRLKVKEDAVFEAGPISRAPHGYWRNKEK